MPNIQAPQKIEDVLRQLQFIIDTCKFEGSRQGYFAILYYKMTAAVRDAIVAKKFADNARMEKLDVIFANRYLDAWLSYRTGKPVTKSWQIAFDACKQFEPVVLQHLLLGVNAHINLDLAIAAAETSPGPAIFDLQSDFEAINFIIASLTNDIQKRIELISWPMKLIRRITNGKDNIVIEFSITKARQASWAQAVGLAQINHEIHSNYVSNLDNTVATISRNILNPPINTKNILKAARWAELKDVKRVLGVLEV